VGDAFTTRKNLHGEELLDWGKRLAHHDLIAHATLEVAVLGKVAIERDRAQHAHVRLRLSSR
jgi:hypothetical protein